jgi:hypothetical protein
LQLLSAWTWSDDFDLQRKFADLSEELEPFGFRGVGEDITLLLRCCAGVVEGDASPKSLVSLNGSKVRDHFPHVVNGLKGAIDFVRTELHVEKLDNLPYSTLLVPLAVFFATDDTTSVKVSDEQRRHLLRWFWKACFSLRYGRVVQRTLKVDIEEVMKLRRGQDSALDDIAAHVEASFFAENRFNLNTVSSKTLILVLAQEQPRSLVSGGKIDLSVVLSKYNRNEFHHLYPQQYLRSRGVAADDQSPLANMCFINAIDNKILGGAAPSAYKEKVASEGRADILRRALVPEDELFADDYAAFVAARAAALAQAATDRMSA